jgi:fluoroquinolone transport system ATP-binding protein
MISVNDMSFSYTKKPYMVSIDFHVSEGEIFGFLGPSGAGKSTLQKILTGLLTNYSGSVMVNHQEVKKASVDFYEDIGVDFEFPSLYEKLSGRENLKYFASLYKNQCDINQALLSVGLTQDADKQVMHYSKGMKSRLNFIKALVHDPQIIFLDEPTSGLDPTNARIMKDIIMQERDKGKTIILTTHNMYDAQELCDRVAFIVDGQIKALNTPHNLIMSKGATKIDYGYINDDQQANRQVIINKTSDDQELLRAILENRITHIHSSEPNLNDIFMEITGRTLI